MGYKGSFIWKLRQKVGSMRLITATVDVLPIDSEGRVKLAYADHVGGWSIVGGHVELGDSWRSAALNELREEVGIAASKDNLVPWATISGSKRIFSYADGETQPMTMIFLVKNWQEESQFEDDEEISQVGWFTVKEALGMEITPWLRKILLAYQQYQRTGEFQMIEIE